MMLKENFGRISKDILIKIPLNDMQISMQGFDFELSFLDSFVQQQIAEGKKEYDYNKRQSFGIINGMDLVPA